MRVLVVVHGFSPAAQGGSEIYAHDHARMLRHLHGDDVLVITRESDPARAEFSVRTEQRDGLSISWINNTFLTAGSFEETYRNDRIGRIAETIIDRFRPDVAHVHHLTCLSTTIVDALAVRRIPCCFTLHDYWLICHRGQLLDTAYRVCEGPEQPGCGHCLGPADRSAAVLRAAPLVRAIERTLPSAAAQYLDRAGRRALEKVSGPARGDDEARRVAHMKQVCSKITHFFAPSRCMRDRFVQFGVAPERITLSPYGFDRAPFTARPANAHPSHNATAGKPSTMDDGRWTMDDRRSTMLRLGFLGSLMVSKAPDVLLTAFRDLPKGSASVDLFGKYVPYHGDDRYRQQLDAFRDLEGVRVHDPVDHDRIAEALASIDVLVVPSIWPENSPLVISEAFLAGVPVVASRIGGIPEMVTDGHNGLLFRPGDAADLRRALLWLIREPALLDHLRAGMPDVRTLEDDVNATRAIYRAHAGSGSPGRRSRRALTAVVLNYRTPDETLLAVKSILASRRPVQELIVVDNDSGEGCRAVFDPLKSDVTYLSTGQNLGYSGGMNAGIRRALASGAERVLLVNSDMIVPPDCIERLEAALDRVDGAGIAGPMVLARSDPGRVASLGMSYVPSTGRMRQLSVGAPVASLPASGDAVVDSVSGCLMLVTREVLDAIGLLDERYFFSFEDLDFCLKARAAGWSTILASDAVAYHEGGRSIGATSTSRLYFAARNHLLLGRRSDPQAGTLRSLFRMSSIVALNVAHAARSNGGTMPGRLLAVARGTRDYFAGRWGPAPGP